MNASQLTMIFSATHHHHRFRHASFWFIEAPNLSNLTTSKSSYVGTTWSTTSPHSSPGPSEKDKVVYALPVLRCLSAPIYNRRYTYSISETGHEYVWCRAVKLVKILSKTVPRLRQRLTSQGPKVFVWHLYRATRLRRSYGSDDPLVPLRCAEWACWK